MNQEKELYTRRELTREEEAQADALYRELGRAYYEGAFEDPLPQLLPLFDQLTELLREPEKEPFRCPSCGAELSEGDAFCAECGCRLIPEEPKPAAPEAPAQIVCPSCGAVMGPAAKFCGRCGTRIV
ncbi:MAG: zinc ribbon domain-containing protein [Firmicutes bacterium]|nr:zinc ribbon domain-containing protein [Bacillota bacterium]